MSPLFSVWHAGFGKSTLLRMPLAPGTINSFAIFAIREFFPFQLSRMMYFFAVLCCFFAILSLLSFGDLFEIGRCTDANRAGSPGKNGQGGAKLKTTAKHSDSGAMTSCSGSRRPNATALR